MLFWQRNLQGEQDSGVKPSLECSRVFHAPLYLEQSPHFAFKIYNDVTKGSNDNVSIVILSQTFKYKIKKSLWVEEELMLEGNVKNFEI